VSILVWLMLIAGAVYLLGRRRSRTTLVICAQLIGAAAICLVLGQVVWQILRS
jgi:hypothetical protein